ncbi:MAG: alpha-L-rhamnosidase [Halieaceae bacterium]|jgi:alpha-L-rhamnosidase
MKINVVFMKKIISILLAFYLLASCITTITEVLNNLTLSEGFKKPIGFHNSTPTFSWKLAVTKDIKSQSA